MPNRQGGDGLSAPSSESILEEESGAGSLSCGGDDSRPIVLGFVGFPLVMDFGIGNWFSTLQFDGRCKLVLVRELNQNTSQEEEQSCS